MSTATITGAERRAQYLKQLTVDIATAFRAKATLRRALESERAHDGVASPITLEDLAAPITLDELDRGERILSELSRGDHRELDAALQYLTLADARGEARLELTTAYEAVGKLGKRKSASIVRGLANGDDVFDDVAVLVVES